VWTVGLFQTQNPVTVTGLFLNLNPKPEKSFKKIASVASSGVITNDANQVSTYDFRLQIADFHFKFLFAQCVR